MNISSIVASLGPVFLIFNVIFQPGWFPSVPESTSSLYSAYAYAEYKSNITGNQSGWKITLKIKNTGPSDATIDDIFINGKPASTFSNDIVNITIDSTSYSGTNLQSISVSLPSGGEKDIYIYLKDTTNFDSGQTIEVKIHTAAGNEYPKQVTLP